MSFLQRMLIFTLMPIMAWSVMPHVVCRCSTGEIRLICPRLHAEILNCLRLDLKTTRGDCCLAASISEGDVSHAVCCCCCAKTDRATEQSSYSTAECSCSPVIVPGAGATSPVPSEESIPPSWSIELEPIAVIPVPRSLSDASGRIDTGPPASCDLVLLFERFLI